jgi:hypothetical protein
MPEKKEERRILQYLLKILQERERETESMILIL